ncbi:MAG: hypothetical protein E7194_11630, partial [Erysipelotrichaceae bacterium]|nr:hypothetical protein [Erysipelotrichaceae bacterium]
MKAELKKLLVTSLSLIISTAAILPVYAEDVYPMPSQTPELSEQDSSNQILNATADSTGLSEFNGHYYYVYPSGRNSWDATDNYFKGLGGYMAIIESDEENSFVYNLMKNSGYSSAFFGYSDQNNEGTWLWTDGTSGSYTNWHEGEPNGETSENYAMFYEGFADDTWNDSAFDSGLAVIVEWNSLDDYMKITPNEFGGHYYHVYGAGLVSTWQGAKEYCENLGGHLAIIDSSAENSYLYNLMIDQGYDTAYFGYTDEQAEGQWLWCDGSSGTYENWHEGEPNNDGVENYGEFYWMFNDGTWNDGNFGHGTGSDVTAFIAEWDSQSSYSYAVQNNTSANRLMKFNFMDGSDSVLKRTTGIDHVNMHYNGQNQTVEETYAELSYQNSLFDFTFSKDGYRDYIVPKEVIDSLRYETVSHASPYLVAHIMDIYMSLMLGDGKPYISSAYGRVKGNHRYIDIVSSELQLNENESQEIILSAAGSDAGFVKYVLSQDDSHKVESATGKFDAKLFDAFDFNKDVYAYAVDSKGGTTELKKIKLKKNDENLKSLQKTMNFLESGSYSIIGSQNVAFNTNLSLLDKASLAFDVFNAPFSFEINEQKVRISVGFDFFDYSSSSEQIDDGPKNTYNQWADFKKGIKNMVDMKDDLNTDVKKYWDKTIDEMKKKYKNTKDLYDFYKKHGNKKIKSSSKDWNAKIYGYMEGEIVNNTFIITEGAVLLNGEAKFSHTAQHITAFVPWYTRFGWGGSLEVPLFAGKRTIPDSDVPFELSGTFKLTPEVKLGIGLGVDKLTTAGVYGKGTAPIALGFPSKKLTIDVTGEIGAELQFFFLKGNIVFWTGETNLVDTVLGSGKRAEMAEIPYEETWTVMDRDYLNGKAGAEYAPMARKMVSNESGTQMETLYGSVFPNSQPELVRFGDQLMMFWINDNGSRDEYNRMELVYSVYDGSSWSEVKSVCDDGHNDYNPVAVSDGENVYVAWQKLSEIFTEENSTAETIVKSSELWLASYDAENDTFTSERLTENENYEYEPALTIAEGRPVLYYMTCTDNNLGGSQNNTLSVYENGSASVIGQNLNRAVNMDVSSGNASFVMDADGDYTDASDLSIYTVSEDNINNVTDAYSSEESDSFLSSVYGSIDGENKLFVTDGSNIYYPDNSEVKQVFEEKRTVSTDFKVVESGEATYIVWTENDGIYNDLYSVKYQNGDWENPVRVSEFNRRISNVDLCDYNGQVIGVMNDTEVYVNEEDGSFTEGETNLSMFKLSDFTDIEILADDESFDESEAVSGSETVIGVTLVNHGTLPVNTVDFLITDTLGTDSSSTVSVNIPAGGSDYVEVPYTVPETFEKTVITVEAVAENDADTENNKVEINAGLVDLSIQNRDVIECYDGYIIKSLIENRSLIDAENVSFELYAGSMDSVPLDIKSVTETLSNDSYYDLTTVLFTENLEFDETGYCPIYLHVFSESEDRSDVDNWDTVYVKKQEVSLSLNQNEVRMAKGKTCTLTATVYPERISSNITWSSSDPTVATVDENGIVTAVNEGTAVITAAMENGITAQATVTVIDYTVSVYGSSLGLDGKIGINFYLNIAEEDLNDLTVVMKMDEKEDIRVPASEGKASTVAGQKLRMFVYPVAAKEMRDKVTLTVEDAEGNQIKLTKDETDYTEGYPFSAADYFARAEEAGSEKT